MRCAPSLTTSLTAAGRARPWWMPGWIGRRSPWAKPIVTDAGATRVCGLVSRLGLVPRLPRAAAGAADDYVHDQAHYDPARHSPQIEPRVSPDLSNTIM